MSNEQTEAVSDVNDESTVTVDDDAVTADAEAHNSSEDDIDSLRKQLEAANKRADEAEKGKSGADKHAKQERLKRHTAEEAIKVAESTGEKFDINDVVAKAVNAVEDKQQSQKESDAITQANNERIRLDEKFNDGLKKAVTDKRVTQEDIDTAFHKVGMALSANPVGRKIGDLLKGRPDSVAVLSLLAREDSFLDKAGSISLEDAALVIGGLEKTFQSNKTTLAPNPSSDISGSSVVQKDTDDMTPSEYKKHLRAQNSGSVFIE